MRERGHEAIIATSGSYRQKVEALGLGFRAVRPDHDDPETDPDLIRRSMDRRTGVEFVIREYMMSVLRETYEDTVAAADGADLLVSHLLTFNTRLVAEKKGIPWASTLLIAVPNSSGQAMAPLHANLPSARPTNLAQQSRLDLAGPFNVHGRAQHLAAQAVQPRQQLVQSFCAVQQEQDPGAGLHPFLHLAHERRVDLRLMAMPLKTALSRTCDSPTNNSGP